MKDNFLYALCLGVVIGCVSSVLVGAVAFYGALLCCVILGVACSVRRDVYTSLCFIAAGAMIFSSARVSLYEYHRSQETISLYTGSVVLVGEVRAEPDIRTRSTRVMIEVERLRDLLREVRDTPARGTVLAILPSHTSLAYGDTVEVSGTLAPAENFITDSGREFDYEKYLRAQGVDMILEQAQVRAISAHRPSLMGGLIVLKQKFQHALERTLPEPHASLAEGVLLGEKRGLPSEVNDAFINSGLVHVVVLSGYNISIVAEAMLRVFGFLPAMFSLPLTVVAIILFSLMTGAGAATVRAAVMGIIALIARCAHRSADAMRALAVATSVMLLWNPLSFYDPGFVLSVLATFGLISLSPRVEYFLQTRINIFAKRFLAIRSIMASTIAVQIFILPALIYYSGVVSLVSLPANLLVLPIVPGVMLGVFVTGLAALVHPLLALAPVVITQILLSWMLIVADLSTRLPLAYFTLPPVSLYIIIAAYVPLTWYVLRVYARSALKE